MQTEGGMPLLKVGLDRKAQKDTWEGLVSSSELGLHSWAQKGFQVTPGQERFEAFGWSWSTVQDHPQQTAVVALNHSR